MREFASIVSAPWPSGHHDQEDSMSAVTFADGWLVGSEGITVFELRDGHYAPEAKTTQTITLERPFLVTIALSTLTRGLRQ
jgi:hypothetical protein